MPLCSADSGVLGDRGTDHGEWSTQKRLVLQARERFGQPRDFLGVRNDLLLELKGSSWQFSDCDQGWRHAGSIAKRCSRLLELKGSQWRPLGREQSRGRHWA